MTTTILPYDHKKYVEGYRLWINRSPEEILSERIHLWRNNSLARPHQRIFSFHGLPGMGKTWLLLYLKDKIYKEAVYIDLEERGNYSTHVEFLNEMKKKVKQGSPKVLLLVDHVPAEATDEYLKLFEEQVLRPCFYEQGGLLVFAQQHPRNWCWTIPHLPPPFSLNGFNEEGKKRLWKKYDLPSNAKDVIWGLRETSPLLVCLKGQTKDTIKSLELYLKFWLQQTNPPALQSLSGELRLAGALTWLKSMTDVEIIKEIIRIVGEDGGNYVNVLGTLDERQWITPPLDEWAEPVHTVLQLWFRQVEPDLAKELDKRFG